MDNLENVVNEEIVETACDTVSAKRLNGKSALVGAGIAAAVFAVGKFVVKPLVRHFKNKRLEKGSEVEDDDYVEDNDETEEDQDA